MTAIYTPKVAKARKIIAAELDGCYTDIDNAVRLLLADHARLAEEAEKLRRVAEAAKVVAEEAKPYGMDADGYDAMTIPMAAVRDLLTALAALEVQNG